MQLLIFILTLLMAVYAHPQNFPIRKGVLQTDLNAGGFYITNAAGITDPSGNPITGGGGGTTYTNNTGNVGVISGSGIGTNTVHLATVAALTVVSNSQFATRGARVNGVLYSSLEAAVSAWPSNAVIEMVGTTMLSNTVVLNGHVISGGGATILAWNTNAMQIVPNNSIIRDITLSNMVPGVYQYGIGTSSDLGHPAITNWRLENVVVWGDSDAIYVKHTNDCSGAVVGGSYTAKFDSIVLWAPGRRHVRAANFSVGPLTSIAGATLRNVYLLQGENYFTGCTISASGTNLDAAVYVNPIGTVATNVFTGCIIEGNTDSASTPYVVRSSGSGTITRLIGSELRTKSASVVGVRATSFGSVDIVGTSILQGSTNEQVSSAGAASVIHVTGSDITRIGGTEAAIRWRGNVGASNSWVPIIYGTNILAGAITNSGPLTVAGPQTNYSHVQLSSTLGVGGQISGASSVQVGASAQIIFDTRTKLRSGADGDLQLGNFANTGFGALKFGGTTAAFPEILRSGAGLVVRGADGVLSPTNSVSASGFYSPSNNTTLATIAAGMTNGGFWSGHMSNHYWIVSMSNNVVRATNLSLFFGMP